jgi:hypothetical protein
MRIDEIAMRHQWDLGSKIRSVINSDFSMDKNSLQILKSIEKEFYDNDDVIDREKVAKERLEKELPKEYTMYILRHV